MRTPSIKSLAVIFGDKAKQVKALLQMNRGELINLHEVQDLRKSSWNPPATWQLRMTALNALGGISRGGNCHQHAWLC